MQDFPPTLHVTTRQDRGGTARFVSELCQRLPEARHLAIESIQGKELSLRRIGSVLEALRDTDEPIVFSHDFRSHLMVQRAIDRTRGRIGILRNESDYGSFLSGVWFWLFRERFDLWLSNFKAGNQPVGIRIIPDGIDIIADVVPVRRNEYDHPVYTLLANEKPGKGHRALLRMWAEHRIPGTLIMAGDLTKATRAEAHRIGVKTPGHVEAAEILSETDLLLVPSEYAGMPRELVEAMAHGVPVLATPAGGIPNVLSHGVNGFVLALESWPEALRVYTPDKARMVSVRAQEYARSVFRWDKTIEGYAMAALEVYHDKFGNKKSIDAD